ncbi:hypothetical protein [Nereida sp. MMG025]|uniref:hypothetical protein n=1 Tax=Nereida sp. MMG025 TaxID=2909981 RepID=UPI001F33AF97|nr:hypothetical protein [Nereida sp. MMG025]MCF6444470.1 hypothetical protein [Nereida sp. MMG025]
MLSNIVLAVALVLGAMAAWTRFGPSATFLGWTADRFLFAALFVGGLGIVMKGGGV